jgi:hypothetical protein
MLRTICYKQIAKRANANRSEEKLNYYLMVNWLLIKPIT